MVDDKAPGLDGFSPFFKKYWSIIRREVVAVVQPFFHSTLMLDAWKRTFVTLILKRWDASEPSHFRSISLYTTLYKAVARILVTRMKPLLPRLIGLE